MKVEIISKTQGLNSYKDLTNEEVVAAVARHGAIKDDNGRLVKYLINHKHWSPLEHVSFGFLIETRRSISAQIFRHSSMKFQEFSLRYSEVVGYEDIDLRKEHPTNRQSSTESFNPVIDYYGIDIPANDLVKGLIEDIDEVYKMLIEAGVAKECARDILPLCTKTTIHITATFRDLLSFLNVRHTPEAQKEVKDIAYEIGLSLEKEMPNVMGVINWRDGYFM